MKKTIILLSLLLLMCQPIQGIEIVNKKATVQGIEGQKIPYSIIIYNEQNTAIDITINDSRFNSSYKIPPEKTIDIPYTINLQKGEYTEVFAIQGSEEIQEVIITGIAKEYYSLMYLSFLFLLLSIITIIYYVQSKRKKEKNVIQPLIIQKFK